jgi:hypothetical protein
VPPPANETETQVASQGLLCDFRRVRARACEPLRTRPRVPKQHKSWYDVSVVSFTSYQTKPSYGVSQVGVLVGLMHKSGRK